MSKFYFIDNAIFNLNSNGTNTTTLGLVCSPENSRDLMGIIDSSQGKIVISAYKKPENLADKYREETKEIVVKSLYQAIETSKSNGYFRTSIDLQACSSETVQAIRDEFTNKGFKVEYNDKFHSLKINWM